MSSKNDTSLETPSTPTEHTRNNKAIFYALAILIMVIVLVAGYTFWQRSINTRVERSDDASCEAAYSKDHDGRVVIQEPSTDCLLR